MRFLNDFDMSASARLLEREHVCVQHTGLTQLIILTGKKVRECRGFHYLCAIK